MYCKKYRKTSHNKLVNYLFLGLILVIICARPIFAAEWSVEPGFILSSKYNNNIWLSSDAKNQVLDIRLQPKLKLNREAESSLISIDALWSQKKYLSQDEETSGFIGAELNAQKEFARHLFQLNALYRESSTANDETTLTSGESVETKKTEEKLTPSWRMIASQNFSLDLSFNYSRVEFEKTGQQQSQSAYKNSSPTMRGLYQLNENTQWNVMAGSNRYELLDSDYTVDSLFFRVGVDHELNANSQVGLTFGAQQNDSELTQLLPGEGANAELTFSERSRQFTAKASYDLELDKGAIALDISRNLTPSSQGDVQITNRGGISGKFLWSEDWSSTFGLSVENREAVGNNATTVNRQKAGVASLNLDWQINENWRVYLDYRWLIRKNEHEKVWIDNHQVILSMRYTWDKFVFN